MFVLFGWIGVPFKKMEADAFYLPIYSYENIPTLVHRYLTDTFFLIEAVFLSLLLSGWFAQLGIKITNDNFLPI